MPSGSPSPSPSHDPEPSYGHPRSEELRRFLLGLVCAVLLNAGWLAIAPGDTRMYVLLFFSTVVGLGMLASSETDAAGLGVLGGTGLAGILYLVAIAFG
jgi:hypothetical protein